MPEVPPRPNSKRREIELDFIRGIAILMVVDFHAPHPLLFAPLLALGFPNFGWAGVDVFFVLSGFLVGGLLVKEWKVFGRINSRQFLIRRGFKIWPQYYVFLILVLVTGHRTVRQLWGNLLNIQNYAGGIAHTWTLAVEEHAYLLLVLLLAVAARYGFRMRNLFLLLVALAVSVLTLRFTLAQLGIPIFERTDTRLDGILYGVMLAVLYHYAPEFFGRLQSLRWLWISVLAGALLYYRFVRIRPSIAPLSILVADMSGIAALLLLYRHREGKLRPAPYRFLAAIGTYSYGIYLWHVSVIAPSEAIGGRVPLSLRPLWDHTATLILGILIGIVFTKLVEIPALKLRERLVPRRVDSAVGTPAEFEVPTPVHTPD